MKNKYQADVLKIFDDFQKMIQKRRSYQEMMDEVRMMKFKIRPMQGDILLFNLKDERLIEVLWGLGKLDQLFQNTYHRLSSKDKNIFFRIFDGMHQKLQAELGRINLRKDRLIQTPPVVEMEIYKEQKQKKLN
jgi:hypothetical protein